MASEGHTCSREVAAGGVAVPEALPAQKPFRPQGSFLKS